MSLCFTKTKPSRPPSNELTSATGSLVYILNVVDPAYSILSFGERLKDIPKRMEHNKVLTAASKVLTASVFSFYTGSVSSKPLVPYGEALRVLISSVGAVHGKTQIVDTMCAIGILLASHNVRGSNRREFEVLLRGLVYFLDMLGDEELDNAFDNEVVSNLRRLVIVSSIMDPTMRFSPRLHYGKKRQSGLATAPCNVGTARCGQQWRDLIQISSYLEDPISNLDHITTTYQQLSTDLALLEKNATDVFGKVKTSRDSLLSLQYIRQEAGNSGLLTMAMALNMTLRIIEPRNSALLEEAVTFVSVVLRAADRVSLFKPLSTALLGNSLCLAWVVAVNPQEKERVRKTLDEHSYIFRGTTWEVLATKFQKRFDSIREWYRWYSLLGQVPSWQQGTKDEDASACPP
ncbi:transcription factor Cys6, partial [Metarhizium hybridum]